MPAGYETRFQAEDVFLGLKSGCFSLFECLQAQEAGFGSRHCPGNCTFPGDGGERGKRYDTCLQLSPFYYLLSPPSG